MEDDNVNDMSYILNQFEGSINKAAYLTSRKRGRNSSTSTILSISTPLLSPSKSGRDSDMMYTLECDELALQVEHLKDQLSRTKDETELLKERHIRQVNALEQEINSLKKVADQRTEKYFSEKKNWQAKIRELESKIVNVEVKPISSSTKPIPSLSSISDPSNDRNLAKIEEQILSKSVKIKELNTKVAEYEEKICKLEQQLIFSASNIDKNCNADDLSELRELRKRVSSLELSLKGKTKDVERLEQKVKNQNLLVEELSSVQAKLKLTLHELETARAFETTNQVLITEKKQWSTLFADTIKLEPTDSKVISSSDINPLVVLKAYTNLQEKYAISIKINGEIESKNGDLLRKLKQSEESINSKTLECDSSSKQISSLSNKLQLAQQKANLYEGEVSTLRALVKSYDAEANFGKTEINESANSKDSLIATLRNELDNIRNNISSKCDSIISTQNYLPNADTSHSQVGAEDLLAENNQLKNEVKKMKNSLHELQHMNLIDYVPSETKVLHMINNPFSSKVQSIGKEIPSFSTLPNEKLKHLVAENKLLKKTVSTENNVAPEKTNPQDQASALSQGEDSKKLNQRLKEMFKERITTFREAVYLLTGYKIDLYSADSTGGYPKLKLRSMYAENPEDALLFQWRDDALELIETPFVSKLDPKLFAYLNQCNSVPSFLSNVTIELFDSQTFVLN